MKNLLAPLAARRDFFRARRFGRFVGMALITVVAVVVGMGAVGCDGARVDVRGIAPRVGEIRESFREPAMTRLANTYLITMPVDGRISRIDLEPGDAITGGQALVGIDRVFLAHDVVEAQAAVGQVEAELAVIDSTDLEQTNLRQTRQILAATAETIKAAQSQVDAARVRAENAEREFDRLKALREQTGEVTESELDARRTAAETALIELREREFTVASLRAQLTAAELDPQKITDSLGLKKLQRHVLAAQLDQARARLARARHRLELASIAAPVTGVVLEKYEQGDRMVMAGTPLLLVGDLGELEAEADVLTQDALRLEIGSEVYLDPGIRLPNIKGSVERIEPMGFTKLSALGVEQQRVKVIVRLDERPEGIGVGFRLQARFFTGTKDRAVVVPRYSVMQAEDRSYYVFRVDNGRLARQSVTVGLRSDLEIEITSGLDRSVTIVAAPDTTMRDGMSATVTITTPPPSSPPTITTTTPTRSE